MKKISIIIPAHNEEKRIGTTLREYCTYFSQHNDAIAAEFIVVLNGCSDNTHDVVTALANEHNNIHLLDIATAGKGIAIAHGFAHALTRDNDYIGFVDADMATQPCYFHELFTKSSASDGAIASRYAPGAHIFPPRPRIKMWGRRLIYDNLVYVLFGLPYHDTQCGAKLFSRDAIETITPQLKIRQWACDVELLYLCKRHGFVIKEVPTTWYDQEGSKLKIRSGFRMLGSLFKLRMRFLPFKNKEKIKKPVRPE